MVGFQVLAFQTRCPRCSFGSAGAFRRWWSGYTKCRIGGVTGFPMDLKPHWRLPSQLGYGPDSPPDQYHLGDVWITRHRDGPRVEYITVEHADAHTLIGDELLRDIIFDVRRYNTCAWVTLEDPNYYEHKQSECASCTAIECAIDDPVCFTSMMLHINARNRHLVYRIGHYRPAARVWEAAWPD